MGGVGNQFFQILTIKARGTQFANIICKSSLSVTKPGRAGEYNDMSTIAHKGWNSLPGLGSIWPGQRLDFGFHTTIY